MGRVSNVRARTAVRHCAPALAAVVALLVAPSCGGGSESDNAEGSGNAAGVGGTEAGGQTGSSAGSPGGGGADATGGGGASGDSGGSRVTGGSAGTGGVTGGRPGTGGVAGGTGGSDCQCPSAVWEPVCGVDGNVYNAVCGADCVPVDIACVGECPCDPEGASCDIGCMAYSDSGWCESPTVEWVCDGGSREDLLYEIGCEVLPTGAIRYCCPPEFLSACH
jgi:hypothetical protein